MKSNSSFETFLGQLKTTNATLDFFSDFPKIQKNASNIAIALNTLNYLLHKENLRQAVEQLWHYDKNVFQALDILIATRQNEHKMFIDEEGNEISVHSLFDSVNGIMKFLETTKLSKLFKGEGGDSRSGQLCFWRRNRA